MKRMTFPAGGVLAIVWLVWATAQAGPVEDALSSVRDVRADMFSRQSSVLGELPGPGELAEAELRARPIPRPQANQPRTLNLDAAATAKVLKDVEAFLAVVEKSRSRSFPVIPLGITGGQVREVVGHAFFRVYKVLPKTPADGLLGVGDVIVGANGQLLTDAEDPRPALGYALAASQSPQLRGVITFHVVRGLKIVNVDVDLGCTDYYSETWPFDCKKSDLLRKQTLDVVSDNSGDRHDFWTPLYLLASGDEGALEKARRMLYECIPDPEKADDLNGSSWSTSYRLINLCEYYLLTGDSAVMPAIKKCARIMEWNQFPSGGWSHGHGGGYGEITNVGLASLMSLVLARECGLKVDEMKIARSVRAFGRYCGTNFPYGMGTGGAGRSGRMDNGMNAMAAIIYHLLGEEEMSRRWARSVCYMWMAREHGHAEGIFSMAWGPIAAALAPKEEFHMFMNQMLWHYEFGRASDGGMMFLRKGRWDYPVNQTAAVGLFLYLPQHRLRVLGAPKGVFGAKPSPGLEKAALLFRDKKFDEMKAAVASCGAADSKCARDLLAACERIDRGAEFTLKLAEKDIRDFMPATAKDRLDAVALLLGHEPPAAKALRARLPENPKDSKRPAQPSLAACDPAWKKELGLPGNDGGFACEPDYIAETNAKGLEGMSPEQIARFLGHFNAGPADGAAMALADQGAKALPLIDKLLHDTNPYVRAGAINALAYMNGLGSTQRKKKGAVAARPADLRPVIAKLDSLAKDPHPEVQRALMGIVNAAQVENDTTHAIAVAAASNPDPTVQSGAIKASQWVTDDTVALRIGMSVVKSGREADTHDLSKAYICLLKRKEDARPSIPDIVRYFNEEAHLVRGFFSNGPLERGLDIIDFHFDPELEKAPGLVPAISKAFTRVPYNTYAGWVKAREHAIALLLRLSPASAPALQKAADEERKWVETEDPEILDKATQMSDAQKRTELLLKSVKYLEDVAAWLQAGKPANGKPTLAYDPKDPQDTDSAAKKAAKDAAKKAKNKQEAAKEKAKKQSKGMKPPLKP
jgi:hypothetical protein